MRKFLLRGVAIVVLALLTLYAWPLWSAFQLRQALKSGDPARLEPRVDWPVLRANLRATVRTNLQASEGGWFRRNAVRTLGPFVADRAIETLVTPQGLARFIRTGLQNSGQNVASGKKAPAQATANPAEDGDPSGAAAQAAADPMAPRRLRYAFFETPSRFRVEVADTTNPSRRLVSILERRGLGWLLTNVYFETRG